MNALPSTKTLSEGDRVVTADGKSLGNIKEIKPDSFKVDARWAPDYWLGTEVVDNVEHGIVQLLITREGVGPAKIPNEKDIDGYELPSGKSPDMRSF